MVKQTPALGYTSRHLKRNPPMDTDARPPPAKATKVTYPSGWSHEAGSCCVPVLTPQGQVRLAGEEDFVFRPRNNTSPPTARHKPAPRARPGPGWGSVVRLPRPRAPRPPAARSPGPVGAAPAACLGSPRGAVVTAALAPCPAPLWRAVPPSGYSPSSAVPGVATQLGLSALSFSLSPPPLSPLFLAAPISISILPIFNLLGAAVLRVVWWAALGGALALDPSAASFRGIPGAGPRC